VEAIEQRGHEAVVINHTKCFLLIEGEIPTIRYEGKSIVGIDAIIPRIGTSVTAFGCAVVRSRWWNRRSPPLSPRTSG
jgi:ribosomal protein S6--L-glutamate ligase